MDPRTFVLWNNIFFVIFVHIKCMEWYLGDPTCSHNLLFVHHLLRPEIFVNITIRDLSIVNSRGCKISAEQQRYYQIIKISSYQGKTK